MADAFIVGAGKAGVVVHGNPADGGEDGADLCFCSGVVIIIDDDELEVGVVEAVQAVDDELCRAVVYDDDGQGGHVSCRYFLLER